MKWQPHTRNDNYQRKRCGHYGIGFGENCRILPMRTMPVYIQLYLVDISNYRIRLSIKNSYQ
jgi:hypothetical protein